MRRLRFVIQLIGSRFCLVDLVTDEIIQNLSASDEFQFNVLARLFAGSHYIREEEASSELH